MDFASLIIGMFLLTLFIGPLVYATNAQKRKNKQILNIFSDLAIKHNLSITTFELWNNFYVIGIDTKSGKVLYLKKKQLTEQVVLIDLSQVGKCKIGKFCKSSNNKKEAVIYRIELIFTFYNPAVSEISVEFFNNNESLFLNGELPFLEKWVDLINMNLSGKYKQEQKPISA